MTVASRFSLSVDDQKLTPNILFFALSSLVVGSTVVMHLIGTSLAIVVAAIGAIIVCLVMFDAIPSFLLFSFVFQNLFVSFISPHLGGVDDFGVAKGYNFIMMAVVWVVCLSVWFNHRDQFSDKFDTIFRITLFSMFFVIMMFFYGAISDVRNAVVYFRNIASPLMFFQIVMVVVATHKVRFMSHLIFMAWIVLIFGFAEAFFHEELYELINGNYFYYYKEYDLINSGKLVRESLSGGRVVREFSEMNYTTFFNLNVEPFKSIKMQRLMGPNFHPISFGYVVSFFSLVSLVRRHYIYLFFSIPLLVLIGAKGALIVFLISLFYWMTRTWSTFKGLPYFLIAFLSVYAVANVVFGLSIGDFHVLGLIAGVNGFLSNPFGHGIGNGGNLGTDFSTINWSAQQALGTAGRPVESSVGVLMWQMGIFGAFLIYGYGRIAQSLWVEHERDRNEVAVVAMISVITLLYNGLFQEEAFFALLALPIFLLIPAVLLGKEGRKELTW